MVGTPNNVHVIDRASIPKGPIGPRRAQGVLLALVAALVFGTALALFLDYLDDTIKTADDIESGLGLPSLAVIGVASKKTQRLLTAASRLQQPGHRTDPALLINEIEPSAQAEAYKHLRTSILLSTPGGAPRSLLVTSSAPAEGKTTTAINTATVLAQTGARVLIIDADMRRPRLHQVFGLPNDGCLSAILASEIAEADIMARINRYKDSNIYLLSSGAIPPNPAELLGSNQMKRLLDIVSNTFTHIVIDSPPIASFTDGVLIASLVDGVILVVHGGKTSRQVVKRSRQILNEIGAKIIGVVLNRADVDIHDYCNYRYKYEAYQPQPPAGELDAVSASISVTSN
jgi:capsular exopolysaccharide synthesis family protein